jgi:hypothetical protein
VVRSVENLAAFVVLFDTGCRGSQSKDQSEQKLKLGMALGVMEVLNPALLLAINCGHPRARGGTVVSNVCQRLPAGDLFGLPRSWITPYTEVECNKNNGADQHLIERFFEPYVSEYRRQFGMRVLEPSL